MAESLSRYLRQVSFAPIGPEGQARIAQGEVVLCGCGALGSNLASSIARAGVRSLKIIDRDVVEEHNLQRQTLFDEDDVRHLLPKAIAAERKLRRVNSQVRIEGIVESISAANILKLLQGADLILDGTDNFETRYLINDASQKLGIPWVFGACAGSMGLTMTVVPGETPCLRCVLEEPPPPESFLTCEVVGIIGTIASAIAAIQATEAIKILAGRRTALHGCLLTVDLWAGTFERHNVTKLREATDCPACKRHIYEYLEGKRRSEASRPCGRGAVEILPERTMTIPLDMLAGALDDAGKVSRNEFVLRLAMRDHTLTVFPDGRAIIQGTDDPVRARSLYERYVMEKNGPR